MCRIYVINYFVEFHFPRLITASDLVLHAAAMSGLVFWGGGGAKEG